MNENPQVGNSSRGAGSSAAMGFVLGALVGAGIVLLLAPGTGKETRRRFADAGRRWRNAARSRFDQVRDTANELRQDTKSALEAGREAFDQSRKSHEPRPASGTELKG